MNYFHFQSLPSTQDKAFDLLETEMPPLVVSAAEQTKGRGRLQREWIHEKQNSLAMTLAFKMPSSKMSGLSLVAGLACLKSFSSLPLELKWPNDLMLNDSKVGGILVESKISGSEALVALGIGLNLKSLETAPYRGMDQSIRVEDLAPTLWNYLQLFFENGFSFFHDDYEKRLWKKNQNLQFKIQNQSFDLKVVGVDESGALIAEQGGKIILHDSGEIIFGDSQ